MEATSGTRPSFDTGFNGPTSRRAPWRARRKLLGSRLPLPLLLLLLLLLMLMLKLQLLMLGTWPDQTPVAMPAS